MMARRQQQQNYIRGAATHRRTENDYMGSLLDTVTLEDWREVIAAALQAAKEGDPQARAWLAHYLIGKPEGKAPTPLTVMVQQLNGADSLIDRLARPVIEQAKYPALHHDDDWEASVKAAVAAELAEKIGNGEARVKPIAGRLPAESDTDERLK